MKSSPTDSVHLKCAYLLEAGDGVHEFDVQLGVVLSQRLVSVVADELYHRAERQGVGEAVLPVAMVDLDQLVVASFPECEEKENRQDGEHRLLKVHPQNTLTAPFPSEHFISRAVGDLLQFSRMLCRQNAADFPQSVVKSSRPQPP